ncbi:MAG: IMP cyclohydrolase [Deltaproteobacteria bacterium]|nr:IMP cyclohydrolase [Deltaproteobacteria bacterium]MBW2305473.1 IMP cyclohydrolase [Deltaproteobacteria bacterium]
MGVIRRAIISVTDKSGIAEFATELGRSGVEILSTGGTAAALRKVGLPVRDVSDYTGFPEMLDGRVKTLHPLIHGGLLALRDRSEHVEQMEKAGILPIDMVVVNLYAFEQTVAKPGVSLEDAMENIDIGGPSMLRAAAKNYPFVTVVTDPSDYARILQEMKESGGTVSRKTNFYLARKVFRLTSAYDRAIADYLDSIR